MGKVVGSKWLQFQTSIFSQMSELAAKYQAVNLGQGFPDFDGPDVIKEEAIAAIHSTKNQYAPANGILPLRELLASRQADRSGLCYDAAGEVTVFSGATEAIFSTMLGLLEPGDEVISFAPYYDSYPAAVLAAGAEFKTIDLTPPNWNFDIADVRRTITAKTRAILLNTPHNPSGKVFSKHELTQIADLAKEYDLIVISDEVYEELVFDQHQHISIATLPQMRERTVLISSTSKTFSMTGWKIGYAFAPAYLTGPIRAIHQFTVFCSATPLQWGMIAALQLPQTYYDELRLMYHAQRRHLQSILSEAGFNAFETQGTYFTVADYSALSDLRDIDFAKKLAIEHGVAAIPLSPLYNPNSPARDRNRSLRFAFCKSAATLDAAAEKFARNPLQR